MPRDIGQRGMDGKRAARAGTEQEATATRLCLWNMPAGRSTGTQKDPMMRQSSLLAVAPVARIRKKSEQIAPCSVLPRVLGVFGYSSTFVLFGNY
jgi:hypothetical protein